MASRGARRTPLVRRLSSAWMIASSRLLARERPDATRGTDRTATFFAWVFTSLGSPFAVLR